MSGFDFRLWRSRQNTETSCNIRRDRRICLKLPIRAAANQRIMRRCKAICVGTCRNRDRTETERGSRCSPTLPATAATGRRGWRRNQGCGSSMSCWRGQPAGENAIGLEIERAVLLGALDRRQDAQQAFIDILRRAPDPFQRAQRIRNAADEYGRDRRRLPRLCGGDPAPSRKSDGACQSRPICCFAPTGMPRRARITKRCCGSIRIMPQAHQGLGAVLADLGDRAGARDHFRKGLSRPRDFDPALSRHQAAGRSAATGLVGRRQYPDRGVSGRLRLSDLGDRRRLSRSRRCRCRRIN